MRNPAQSQYGLFGKICAYTFVGSVLAAVWLHTIAPVVVAGISLFCILSFMNGLG